MHDLFVASFDLIFGRMSSETRPATEVDPRSSPAATRVPYASMANGQSAATRIAELESIIDERDAEIARLRERLAAFELADPANRSSTAANAGRSRPLVADDSRALDNAELAAGNGGDDAEGPVFPPEIFVIIASYLKPGSKTLATLCLASKLLHKLLDPVLVAKIHLDWWNFRLKPPPELEARGRLESVRELDLGYAYTVRTTGLMRGEPVIRGCRSLRKLKMEISNSIDLENLLRLCQGTLNSLEVLEIDAVEDEVDAQFPEEEGNNAWVEDIPDSEVKNFAPALPKLRTLKILGNYLPNFTDLLIAASPALSELRASVYIPWDENDYTYTSTFLSKVTSWGGTNEPGSNSQGTLVELADEPLFRPRAVYVDFFSEADLYAVHKIPSVEEWGVGFINVDSLLNLNPLPALKSLIITHAPLNWRAAPEQLEAVKRKLLALPVEIKLEIGFDHHGAPEPHQIANAAFWITVAESRPHTILTLGTDCRGYRVWKGTVDGILETGNDLDLEAVRILGNALEQLSRAYPVLKFSEEHLRALGTAVECAQRKITLGSH